MLVSSTGFRLRRFVTNAVLLSFLVSAVSGVALFFRPEGSLARWIGWSFAGFDKKQWEAAHIVCVVAFLFASALHIVYNWRALVAAVRKRMTPASTSHPLAPSLELMAAAVATGVLMTAALAGWQPVASLVSLRTAMKDASFVVTTPPPIPDADRLTLADLCRQSAVPEQQALENARRRGIRVTDVGATLADTAKANKRSPEAVYQALLGAPAD